MYLVAYESGGWVLILVGFCFRLDFVFWLAVFGCLVYLVGYEYFLVGLCIWLPMHILVGCFWLPMKVLVGF